MEYLVLGAVAMAALFFLFPRASRRPGPWLMLIKPAILGAVVIAGWIAVTTLGGGPPTAIDPVETASIPHERRTDQTMDYARGDEALRALLSQ
jgi:hypothetical protein